jgi:glycosyltransferase involved in cell wall biosynthesis
MERPLVSILIPSYKPRHFEIALTSALAQAYEHKEIIVSDDCPTEDIREICERFPAVNYSRNPDRGPNTNLLRLTRLAGGKYLKYLMDDDILHPLCVGQMVDGLEANPDARLAFSARDRIDTENRIINRGRAVKTNEPMTRLKGLTLRTFVITKQVNMIGEFTTVMFRRADVHGPDGLPIYTSYHGDPIMGLTDIGTFLQLCERGDALYFSEPLSLFRIHESSNTNDRQSPGFHAGLAEWATLVKHACADPEFSLADRRAAATGLRERLGRWLGTFPQLAAELELLDRLGAALDAEDVPV